MKYSKFIAKSKAGAEFLFKYGGAFFVSKSGAAEICELLNKKRYDLQPGEVWHVHDVSSGDEWRIDRAIKKRNGCYCFTRA